MSYADKPFSTPEETLSHHGVKGMKWGVRREERLNRLERVASGKGSFRDNVKTATTDIALGSSKSQLAAQIRAAHGLKEASKSGEHATKALLTYYGTRTVPQVAALTFNRPKK